MGSDGDGVIERRSGQFWGSGMDDHLFRVVDIGRDW